MRKQVVTALLLITGLLFLSGCSSTREFKKTGFYLDSVVEVTAKVKGKKNTMLRAEKAMTNSFSKMVELDQSINVLSPISEISAINSNAGLRNVEINSQMYDLLKKSISGSILTDGYFDITWRPLVKLFEGSQSVSDARAMKAQNACGYGLIQLDKVLNRVRFGSNAAEIDFDHIKHGYAVDMVVAELTKHGLSKKGYIKVGSASYYIGSRKETFKFGEGSQIRVKLKNCGVARINADDNYFVNSGFWKKYLPVEAIDEDIVAIIVIAPNATTAEVLANAFYFMGLEKASQKIAELKGQVNRKGLYNFIFVVKDGEKLKIVNSFKIRPIRK